MPIIYLFIFIFNISIFNFCLCFGFVMSSSKLWVFFPLFANVQSICSSAPICNYMCCTLHATASGIRHAQLREVTWVVHRRHHVIIVLSFLILFSIFYLWFGFEFFLSEIRVFLNLTLTCMSATTCNYMHCTPHGTPFKATSVTSFLIHIEHYLKARWTFFFNTC